MAHTAVQVAQAAAGEVAEAIREQVRAELVALIHGVVDAESYEQAEAALVILRSHPQGAAIASSSTSIWIAFWSIWSPTMRVCTG